MFILSKVRAKMKISPKSRRKKLIFCHKTARKCEFYPKTDAKSANLYKGLQLKNTYSTKGPGRKKEIRQSIGKKKANFLKD